MKDGPSLVKRLSQDGILLALLCALGMFSFPLGESIKVSLQLLVIFIICFLCYGVFDCLMITGCYLLMGLFLPIYAGFCSGITPTFGFVIGFVLASPVIYFMNKLHWHPIPRMALACFLGLLTVYFAGSLFMMLYLNWGLGQTLLVSVVPYIPFDLAKIAIAILLSIRLRKVLGIKEP